MGNKLKEFKDNHPEICAIALLSVLCAAFLFFGLNCYPLLDVDETRYAIMSRDLLQSGDWNLLKLNALPFFEKPPLYFWLVALSISAFGKFSEFAVRFPIALMASFLIFFTYIFGKKVLSRKFGLLSAIILLTSVFFLILSHVAILDMVLTVFLSSSLYCAFLSGRVKEIYQKYCWWGFWLFAALGFLAKGLLAIAIPLVIVFVYGLITHKLKDFFKPTHFIVGAFIFLLISLPWHLVMFKDYGWPFVQEYFVKHHFARLLTSEALGRKHGFLYFIPVFIVAFMPWTFIFIASLIEELKKLYSKYKTMEGKFYQRLYQIITPNNQGQELLLFLSLFFMVVFLVMSISSTKLPTYILPTLPAAALLTGYFWCKSKDENAKIITISTYLIAMIFIFAALLASIAFIFLPSEIIELVSSFKYSVLIGCALVGMYLLVKLQTKESLSIFSSYVVLMLFVITFAVTNLFSMIYSTGENELVLFSNYANAHSSRLVTFDFAVKPSTKLNFGSYVYFITDDDFLKLYEIITNSSDPTYVIVKNKQVERYNYQYRLDRYLYLVEKGKTYSLYINKDIPEKSKKIMWLK